MKVAVCKQRLRRRDNDRKTHMRRVGTEWRAEDGGLENCSQHFLLCCVAGVASREGQSRHSPDMKGGKAEHPSLPPPPHRHSFNIQHKAQAMPVPQQGGGKHELAGEQHTLHLLVEPAGTETLLTLRPWLSAVRPGKSIEPHADHGKVSRPQQRQSALGKAGCCGRMTA